MTLPDQLKRGVCILHGEVVADADHHDGRLRCPVILDSPQDCGYGDPCDRLLSAVASDEERRD